MSDRGPSHQLTYERLWRLARPQWRRLAWGLFFLALGSAMSLVFPQILRRIIDEAMVQKDVAAIDRAALLLLGVFAVQGISFGLRYLFFTIAGERVVTQLREDIYRNLIRQEVAFFDTRKTGELTSRLASDSEVLRSAVTGNVSQALRNGFAVVGGVALLLYTSPVLTALMLGVVPPVALGAMAYGRRVRKLSREVQDALAGANEIADESLAGIRTVRSFAAESAELGRYTAATERAFELARRRARTASTFMAAASFAGYVSTAVILWYGGHLVIEDRMSAGQLSSFLVYTLLVAFSLGGLSDVWADLMKASGASERIFELLERDPALVDGTRALPSLQGKLALSHVSFRYPARPDVEVLRDLSLEVAPGEVVAIVGPSGAGKSTLAALISRFYDPLSGSVSVDDIDVRELEGSWLRRQVGVVAQEPLLFSSSIAENIRYGRPSATDADVEAAARTANAEEFIQRFPDRYQTLVGERGVQLSGGQKQRIAIARAALKDPRILILDEATSALDAESEHWVKDALDRLMQGRTTLIIAHRLSTVLGANRVLVLDGGRIVQSGSHRALMGEEGLYRRLVERQFVAA
jgi:ABC transporter fused permease/ATP-binding protein